MPTPEGWDAAVAMFGDPAKYRLSDGTLSPNYEHDHIVRVQLPRPMPYVDGGMVSRVAVNRAIAEITVATLTEIAQFDSLWKELQPYAGGFEPRLKRGSDKPSLHTLGAALDFNPTKYPLASDRRMPDELVKVFIKHGWFYGGDFRGRKDPMHFQYARRV